MPIELSLPFLAVCGAALTALAYRFWPRIAIRTHAEKHHGIGVREIAVSLDGPGRGARHVGDARAKRFEFVIYLTLKSCNQ
ncbi:MAG TPA: hypothetical protein VH249_09690 [Xanthobacteraceae bacterium]|jgi:hypothetical protein|nr:hypothetical protein [Xanthobacteraceae bacterium]